MSKRVLPMLPSGDLQRFLSGTPYESLGDRFLWHNGDLVLVIHEMTGTYGSRQRYLQLGIISSQGQGATFSRTHVYLPTTRFVWSWDNCDIKYKRGEVILPITEGQRYAFLEVPLGTDYSRTLFIGTTEVERWFVEQNELPYLRGDLFRALGYPMDEGENFSLDLSFA